MATINKSSQKIFNNSLFYSIGTIASKAVGFFLVPIYTNNMSTDDYGVATTIISFVTTFGIVIMLSLRSAMIRFYNEYNIDERRRFVGTIVSTVLINAFILGILLCVCNSLYMPLLFNDMEFFPLVFWGVMALSAEGVYLTYQSLLQAKQDGRGYSLNSIIYLFFHAATVILFVAFLQMGALGMVLSCFVTNACFAVYGIWSMKKQKHMEFCLDKKMLVKSLKYSLPILPHDLSNNLNVYGIKVVINQFLSFVLSGLYSLASQFSTIVGLVQSSINLAFRPWFIEQMQSGEEGRSQIKYMSCMIMAIFAFCAVGVALFSKEIIMIMAEASYLDAWTMVPFFIATQLISFIYYSHVQVLMYNVKYSKFTVICSFSGLIVNIGLAVLLVNFIGIYGILIAQIVSQIAMASITVIMSRKAEKVDFGLSKMVIYCLLAFALIAVGMWVSSSFNIWISILIKVGIVVVAFLLFLVPYGRDFISLIKGLVKRKPSKKSRKE